MIAPLVVEDSHEMETIKSHPTKTVLEWKDLDLTLKEPVKSHPKKTVLEWRDLDLTCKEPDEPLTVRKKSKHETPIADNKRLGMFSSIWLFLYGCLTCNQSKN